MEEADPVRLGECADAHAREGRGARELARQTRLMRRMHRVDTRERLQR